MNRRRRFKAKRRRLAARRSRETPPTLTASLWFNPMRSVFYQPPAVPPAYGADQDVYRDVTAGW